ncbi:phosphoesterase PA-phosphatase [Thiocystis minor]|uniref:phosphatase PAP2 family protein n=1 Tax=Thiocystis minor TaxID=61597 RepID=UPI0019140B5D|nr:phosphoesterase PA-phosphatase [Thiocystis minor]
MQTLAATRRYWLPQLMVLILLALIGTLPFWWTDLDLRAAAVFYHPEADDPWFESRRALWLFLYQAAPLLIGLILVGSLTTLFAGVLWPRYKRLRIHALFLIATAILGPGLTVNALLKDHMGRPRPHQTVELGGAQAYLPPLAVGEAGKGKSFPCGHSSAGFMLGAFFMIWRRRRPWLAGLALLGSLALGTLLGIGRMTAGDHFLSDVIWSGVIAYGIAFVLYYFVLRIPQREFALEADAGGLAATPSRPLRYPVAAGLAYGLAVATMLFGVLLATPVHENRSHEVVPADDRASPRTLRLMADTAQITLVWHDWPDRSALILLKGRGFGLPGTRVRERLEERDGVLTFEIAHTGFFTEKDTTLTVGAVPGAWDRIEIATDVGDIRVYPLPPSSAPTLDLKTGDGQVRRDIQ